MRTITKFHKKHQRSFDTSRRSFIQPLHSFICFIPAFALAYIYLIENSKNTIMKTKSREIFSFTFIIFFLIINSVAFGQIPIQGLSVDNEGGAGWNANGTGPEPAAYGHQMPWPPYNNMSYYGASRDYTDPQSNGGFHFLDNFTGFPLFAQALANNGYTAGQVKVKWDLFDAGDDIEGTDWFLIGNMHYANFFDIQFTMYLNGEAMLSGSYDYNILYISESGSVWNTESSFGKVEDASSGSSASVQAVAVAFLQDLDGEEIRTLMQLTYNGEDITGNGRSGAYYDITGSIEKGLPEFHTNGLNINHEGFAGWNSDGTGPEPDRTGHAVGGGSNQMYYIAGRDYDGIDPDPSAGFLRLLDNQKGFRNFYLQLAYLGFMPEQAKLKMGLSDLDEDIYGEDWTMNGSVHNCNYYHAHIWCEVNGEPVFGFMVDTVFHTTGSVQPYHSYSVVYNATDEGSTAAKALASSFFRDLGYRQVRTYSPAGSVYVNGSNFNANGRDGAFWEISDLMVIASEGPGTYISEVNGSETWTKEGHPYIVEENLIVPNGETLIIEPGVWVKNRRLKYIDVQGNILAAGDTCNTGCIVFTAVNPAEGSGGLNFSQISNNNDSSLLVNCLFEYGFAEGGTSGQNSSGAVGMKSFSKLRIDHCLFRHNWASIPGYYPPSGGAIGMWASSPVIRYSKFYNNKAEYGGAIICFQGAHPTIDHCLFHHNEATADAGAIIIYTNCLPNITNCTFIKNDAYGNGGAVDVYDGSKPDFVNCIFWNNSANQGKQISVTSQDCVLDISYCDLQGGEAGIGPYGIGTTGTYENNIDTDPLFVNPLACNYHIPMVSPCHNAGDPNITDPDGSVSDIGCFYAWDPVGTMEYPGGINNLWVFPNPCADFFELEFKSFNNSQANIDLLDLSGKIVMKIFTGETDKGILRIRTNIHNIPPGVYYCRLLSENQTQVVKILKK